MIDLRTLLRTPPADPPALPASRVACLGLLALELASIFGSPLLAGAVWWLFH